MRITTNPEILGGKPIIKGTRISVELVLELISNGNSIEDILSGYPTITKEDILACVSYAKSLVSEQKLMKHR